MAIDDLVGFQLTEKTLLAIFATLVIGIACIVYLVFTTSRKVEVTLDDRTDVSKGLQREQKVTPVSNTTDEKVLSASVFKKFQVLKVINTSHNTKLIRFEIPHGKGLGLPIGRHVSVRAEVDGKLVMRAYTPTSRPDQKGFFDLLVKTYTSGKMSPHLHSLKIGSSLEFRGPVGRFQYVRNSSKHMGLIAGGTGLTPCLQIIRCILEGPEGLGDNTIFTLFFQNRTESDVLLRDELDSLGEKYKARLSVIYFLSNPSDALWGNGTNSNEKTGYIDKDIMGSILGPEVCQFVCLCGPGGFTESMTKLLADVGQAGDDSVHVF